MMSSSGELYLDSLAYEAKDGVFHDEKEVRAIVPSRDVALHQIKHRATKFGVTPSLRLRQQTKLVPAPKIASRPYSMSALGLPLTPSKPCLLCIPFWTRTATSEFLSRSAQPRSGDSDTPYCVPHRTGAREGWGSKTPGRCHRDGHWPPREPPRLVRRLLPC